MTSSSFSTHSLIHDGSSVERKIVVARVPLQRGVFSTAGIGRFGLVLTLQTLGNKDRFFLSCEALRSFAGWMRHVVSVVGMLLLAVGVSLQAASLDEWLASLPDLGVPESDEDLNHWEQRREELKDMLAYLQYGAMPPRPERVVPTELEKRQLPEWNAREERITLEIGSDPALTLRMALYLPETEGPHPILVREEHALGHLEEVPAILRRGYGFVEFAREDLDPDAADTLGTAQAAYPEYDWATLAVWAWGGMRVRDYLETRPEVHQEQVGVVGHSRGGKMALIAGAWDTRFSLVVANGSGAGGAGSYRLQPEDCESLDLITRPERFGYWFHARLRWFVGKEAQLPFDQHFLKALVAPRALLCTEALEDRWANPMGTFMTHLAARPIFDRLGVRERIGIHFRAGGHDLLAADWEVILDFADWHWRE